MERRQPRKVYLEGLVELSEIIGREGEDEADD